MHKRSLLILVMFIILSASGYFLWQAYEHQQRSEELMKKFKEVDESLEQVKKDSLQKDSAGTGAFK
jgi:predicted negative regulator of RcsB-dependent stress response